MKLILIRHGKAEHTSPTGRDFDRNLTPEGIAQTSSLTNYLCSKSIDGKVFCSNAQRTLQTYRSLKDNLPKEVTFSNDLYLASKENLLKLIWENKSSETIVIIGHNNGLSDLASYLLDQEYMLSTSTCVCLHFELDSWNHVSQSTAQLDDQFTPQIN